MYDSDTGYNDRVRTYHGYKSLSEDSTERNEARLYDKSSSPEKFEDLIRVLKSFISDQSDDEK